MTYLKFFSFFILLVLKASFASEYREKIQPIFDNRCIACHSCLNGPCQLNLQNYENFSRGAHHNNVYEGTRLESTPPTRPGIDGKSILDWRKLGFFDLNQTRDLEKNIFYQILGVKPLEQRDIPYKKVEESVSCIDNFEQFRILFSLTNDLKMPYALPPLLPDQRNAIGAWIAKGAPAPERISMPEQNIPQVRTWEKFFNQRGIKEKLVSRYLYEHLFLAHIYFPETPTHFYRLVRSKQKCEDGIDEINTRRPNDDPGLPEIYYCLKYQDTTIVAKTHMPFEFSPKELARIEKIFFSEKWSISKESNYSYELSENPFAAFIDIPVKARYQFLLDHAEYMVSTFIKGPVCNGSNAVNSIQEQFYVMFIAPDSDNMVLSKEFERKAKDLLILPGLWGSDIKLSETLALSKKIVDHREGYRKLRAAEVKKNRPEGHDLKDLWDGEGENPNALLTVFRHDDNSRVIKGWHGDIPKTFFFLDYALFERLVYNLVVNFDVYGNISHQTLTRIYMDLIRMEAEEMFLSFLPPESRAPLRKSWYQGIFTEAMMKYMFPLVDGNIPTKMKYTSLDPKKEFVEQVYYNYLTPKVRGPADPLNWKHFPFRDDLKAQYPLTKDAKILSELTSITPNGRFRFPTFFPEASYLIVRHNDKTSEIFTIIKNREHENIAWILGESLRLTPEEDTLTIIPGFHAYYPNEFFELNELHLEDFKNKVLKLRTVNDYKEFAKEYGVSRVSERFWKVYDLLNSTYKKESPNEFGYLDLTRYKME